MALSYKFFLVLFTVGMSLNPLNATPRTYTLTTESGFKLTDQEREKQNKIVEKKLTITLDDSSCIINEVKIKPREVLVESIDGQMIVDKRPHHGSILITAAGDLQLLTEEQPNQIEKKADDSLCAPVLDPVETMVDANLQTPEQSKIAAKKPSHVRVLLSEFPIQEVDLRFFSDQGFVLAHSRKDPKKLQYPETELHVTTKKGEFYVNGTRFVGDKILIASKSGYIEFGGNKYQGTFNVMISPSVSDDSKASKKRNKIEKKKVLVVNSIDIEDYIFSVVRSESWPNWPLEVNKVFAIACRSYGAT